MDYACCSEGAEAAQHFHFQGASPVFVPSSRARPSQNPVSQGTSPALLQRVLPSRARSSQNPEPQIPQGTSPAPLQRVLPNADLESRRSLLQERSPPVISPAPPLTNPDPQTNRCILQGASPVLPSPTLTGLQSNRHLPHTSSSAQSSKCSSMSHQKRNHMNNLSTNLEQQSALFNVEQPCAHFNSTNLEHRNHIDSYSANFEQRIHSHVSDSLEQRNHVNNFYANLEESTHLNSSSSSCCQPLKHHGRHGEPLYKSLLRPHHCSYMEYAEGPHHPHQHECSFEAENSAAGDCLPHQFTDCTTCRFGFPALPENHTSLGSISKGQNYYSFRALSTNEITLYNWYLIRCSGSHLSEIAVGGFLSSRGMDNERIETSTIVKRLEERKVLTKDGNVVNLVGAIDDYRTVSNGFSLQTVHLFLSGFPHIWNLVVGMGLPAKGVGTNTASRSREFYGGEVTSQVSLQKDFQFQEKCMHQSSVPEGRENETVSCLEVERHHRFKFATKESQGVEAVAKFPESVVLQEQPNALLDGKPQSSEDQPPSNVQVHEKQDKCISPVTTESDKETELARDFDKEKSQNEASHAQMECTEKQLVEVMGPECELENMPIESVEAAMAESRSEDMKPESVTKVSIEDSTQKQDNQAFVENRTDANQPLDLHDNAGTVEISDVKLENASVQSPEISDCHRESRMAKRSKCSQSSLSRKRKVVFNIPDTVETEHPSSTSLSLETSMKGLGRSCSLNSKGAEFVSSLKSVDIEEIMVNKTITAKQKGKRKKKGRFLLPKYKRSAKLMVKSDICENMEDGKGEREVCNEEGLEASCKRRKSTTRIRNSTDEQSGAILSLEQPSPPNKTAKGEASGTALVLEPIINRRVETRQGVHEKPRVKEAAPKKMIAKKGRGFLAKLQHTLKQARVYDDSSQMESSDLVISMIDIQKAKTEIKDSLKVDSRRRKSGEADFDIHLGTSKRRKAKSMKKIETDDPEDSACGKETSKGYCNTLAPTECDSGPSTVASARKRLKQILPPPLPLPLVSVSRQLVSKAFGLKTSRSGRLLVPPLAHWRGQSLVRDMDGGIIAIEDGSQDATREDTGCLTFKPPIEARAKRLQKWLCETASECLTKKLKTRKKASRHKQKCIPLSQS